MSARPASTRATNSGIAAASYWLSPSTLTMTSAPRRQAFQAGAERAQAAVVRQAQHRVGAVGDGDVGGVVAGAVVDHQPFDLVHAGQAPRQRG
nr:hypothetical protein [Lysobacter enzymogenes]